MKQDMLGRALADLIPGHSYLNTSTPEAELGSNFYRKKLSCLIQKSPVLLLQGYCPVTGTFESAAPHAQMSYAKISPPQLLAL